MPLQQLIDRAYVLGYNTGEKGCSIAAMDKNRKKFIEDIVYYLEKAYNDGWFDKHFQIEQEKKEGEF